MSRRVEALGAGPEQPATAELLLDVARRMHRAFNEIEAGHPDDAKRELAAALGALPDDIWEASRA